MNFKHLGMYLLVGIISGGLCTGITALRFFPKIVNEQIPAVILAIAIVVAVRYISAIRFRNGWLSPVIHVGEVGAQGGYFVGGGKSASGRRRNQDGSPVRRKGG